MKLKFFCPRWGCESLSWADFFDKVKSAGYDGVEIGFPYDLDEAEQYEILNGLEVNQLEVIGQHWQTVDSDFEAHKQDFKKQLLSLVSLKPLFINSQTGKDYYSIDQNFMLFSIADKISTNHAVEIIHETHRGKWSFAAHITQSYLELDPRLRITLDVSHWFAVAESLLEDQEAALGLAIQHTDHLHARVGFQEGPQVIDPRSPENETILLRHLNIWDKLISLKREQENSYFTITPEFGAPPYQHLMPFSKLPITNQWDINLWMKDLLKDRYSI
ncbi:sugar phosphate isomerase/epimerase [Pedobacter frigiditerrae]|uniref:Sugar phosphate isomerase/epimerase n=1 Tax=Pedobacter frigiditerrae TaxID=2530452 RepID=A0A4R0MPH7_9SPHI|nr:sugar phosphate isomerase/epimerase [Pedobacter frigiditerrae]TCC88759.1 sugar phosphate isomerase/epimerase [Pedobacter frigiditerrae]